MKVRKLIFNWHQVGSTEQRDGAGEDYEFYELGRNGCVSIMEHTTNNVFSYTIIVESKNNEIQTYRVFNPNHIEYLKGQ